MNVITYCTYTFGLTATLSATLALLASAPLLASDTAAILPPPSITTTTVPPNGDGNPYGVAFVPEGFPGNAVHPGDILVSNFNNSSNLQGTGTTITRIPGNGPQTTPASVFFQGGRELGLTTALGIFREGFVVVGNMPAPQGACPGVEPGSLLVLDRNGKLLTQWSDPKLLNGPWDLALYEFGDDAKLFVSNALSGTVTRIDLEISWHGPVVVGETQIASGYSHRCDASALVVGPTGLVYDHERDVLYVASTEDNAIYGIWGAGATRRDNGTGVAIYQDAVHLHGPLGMAQAPNGHLVVSNSDVINPDPNRTSELVEFTKSGKFVAELSLDPAPGGSFGLAFSPIRNDVAKLAAVDDNANNISIWSLRLP